MSDTTSRKRDSERRTRVHLSFFDRIKFLLLFGITYLVLVWALLSENPLYSFQDAAIKVANDKTWLFGWPPPKLLDRFIS